LRRFCWLSIGSPDKEESPVLPVPAGGDLIALPLTLPLSSLQTPEIISMP